MENQSYAYGSPLVNLMIDKLLVEDKTLNRTKAIEKFNKLTNVELIALLPVTVRGWK